MVLITFLMNIPGLANVSHLPTAEAPQGSSGCDWRRYKSPREIRRPLSLLVLQNLVWSEHLPTSCVSAQITTTPFLELVKLSSDYLAWWDTWPEENHMCRSE